MKNEPSTKGLLSGPKDMMFVMGDGNKIISVEYIETDKGSVVRVSEDGEIDYEATSKDQDTIITQFVTLVLEKMKTSLPQLQQTAPQGEIVQQGVPPQFQVPPQQG